MTSCIKHKSQENFYAKLSIIFVVMLFLFTENSISLRAAEPKTANQGVEWATNHVEEAKKNTNYLVGAGQCVSLIIEYYKFLGADKPSGNAVDYITKNCPKGWTRIQYDKSKTASTPRPGDIAIWNGQRGGGYGHVAIVVSTNSTGFKSVDQNWNSASPAFCNHKYEGEGFWGVIRPNFAVTVVPSTSAIYLNGNRVYPEGYNINDSNYFKLRDLAYLLKNTPNSFSVDWNSYTETIILKSKTPYLPNNSEMQRNDTGERVAMLTGANVSLDGKTLDITAYVINGNNYFKLREIMELFEVNLEWVTASNSIYLTTPNTAKSPTSGSQATPETPDGNTKEPGIPGPKSGYTDPGGNTIDSGRPGSEPDYQNPKDNTIDSGRPGQEPGYIIPKDNTIDSGRPGSEPNDNSIESGRPGGEHDPNGNTIESGRPGK